MITINTYSTHVISNIQRQGSLLRTKRKIMRQINTQGRRQSLLRWVGHQCIVKDLNMLNIYAMNMLNIYAHVKQLYASSIEETVLQDFLVILKRMLQNH